MGETLLGLVVEGWQDLWHAMRALLPAGMFLLVLGLLVGGPGVLTDIRRAAKESGTNLKLLAFNAVVVGAAGAPVAHVLVSLFMEQGWAVLQPEFWTALPATAVVLSGVILGDFVAYWRHRLEHTRFLWPSHAVHHSDTEAHWLTSKRVHPLNRLLGFVTDNAALLLLGLPAEAILANALVRENYSFLTHANLPWTYGPLAKVFVSPVMHRWHHATDRVAYDTNFANIFSLFDVIFGTYRVPGLCEGAVGVNDPIKPGFLGLLVYPFTKAAYMPRRRSAGGQRAGVLLHESKPVPPDPGQSR